MTRKASALQPKRTVKAWPTSMVKRILSYFSAGSIFRSAASAFSLSNIRHKERNRKVEGARPPSCADPSGGLARRRKSMEMHDLWQYKKRDRHFLCDLE